MIIQLWSTLNLVYTRASNDHPLSFPDLGKIFKKQEKWQWQPCASYEHASQKCELRDTSQVDPSKEEFRQKIIEETQKYRRAMN
jgi:hypothetical protein